METEERAIRERVESALAAIHGRRVEFALLARFETETLDAAIIWPWLPKNDGSPDDDIIGFIFDDETDAPAEFYKVSGSEKHAFRDQIGPAHKEPIRRRGWTKEEINQGIQALLESAAEARRNDDIESLMRATEVISTLFSPKQSLWRDDVSEIVLTTSEADDFEFVIDDLGETVNGDVRTTFSIRALDGGSWQEDGGTFIFGRSDAPPLTDAEPSESARTWRVEDIKR